MNPCTDEPDQLFLAPHLAVVARESTRPLARAEPVLDDPREVARLEALRPPPPQTRRYSCAAIRAATVSAFGGRPFEHVEQRAARTEAATSCTRTTAAPCTKHHTVVASVASSRSSTGSAAEQRAEERLARRADEQRHVDARRELGRARAATRGCARRVLPKPIPGSTRIASARTPAATAASTRARRSSPTSRTTSS